MPTYVLACANCGDVETFARMNRLDALPCPICERERPKKIVDFHHQEDRTHLWRGPMGDRHSFALGAEMPDSRKKRDALAKARGVEFITLAEHRAENKEAAEALDYKKHVETGGARIEQPAPSTAPFVPKPAWAESLLSGNAR